MDSIWKEQVFAKKKKSWKVIYMNILSIIFITLTKASWRRIKTSFYRVTPSVQFSALFNEEMLSSFDKTAGIGAFSPTSLAATIVNKLAAISQFRQSKTTPVATSSFSAKDTNWCSQILTRHKQIWLGLFKMDLRDFRLDISTVQLPCSLAI